MIQPTKPSEWRPRRAPLSGSEDREVLVNCVEQRSEPELWLIELDDLARHKHGIERQAGAFEQESQVGGV